MELETHRGHIAGCTTSPNEDWMKQVGRELTNFEEGSLNSKRYLLMDRDTKFCESFRSIPEDKGIEPVRLPRQSPNLKARLERIFGSLKSECLNRMIFLGEGALRNAVQAYLAHYHTERNHQGLNNAIIASRPRRSLRARPSRSL